MKDYTKKAIVVNLLILIGYTLYVNLSAENGGDRALGILIILAFLIGIHVFINFIISIAAFMRKDKATGKTFLLNAGIILLVGFSSCWGSASI